jgi:hypothetical protein
MSVLRRCPYCNWLAHPLCGDGSQSSSLQGHAQAKNKGGSFVCGDDCGDSIRRDFENCCKLFNRLVGGTGFEPVAPGL